MRDWDLFRVFLAVVRQGSVRGASKALGTTHATVSRHIRALETAMHGRLFRNDRVGRRLSELGTRVVPLAEDMERQAAAIERVALAASPGLAGPLRVSMSESLYHCVFAAVLDEFMDRHPMIEPEVIASDDIASLARREADVVVRITRTPAETAVGRKLAGSPLCVYGSAAYLSARPEPDRWIAQQYPPAEKPPFPARVVAKVNVPLAAARMIRDGKGIGMLPCFVGDADPGLIRLPGFEPIADQDIWILTHRDLAAAPRVRAFVDYIRERRASIRARVEGEHDRADEPAPPRSLAFRK